MGEEEMQRIAEKVVERLFTDGTGEPARRLVMEQRFELDGPGWCRNAVRGQVLAVLRDALAALQSGDLEGDDGEF